MSYLIHTRRLSFLLFFLAIGFGALFAWTDRYTMNPDGISYLDMADAYRRGDFSSLLNLYWSPFYPFIIGVIFSFLNPSSFWEFPAVHLVNFMIYIAALAAFHYFLTTFIDYMRHREHNLPEWAWLLFGYTLFLVTSFYFVTLAFVTPDMLVAVFIFLAALLLIRISEGALDIGTFVAFGAVLGAGYLSKAPMFPLAFVFLGTGLLASGNVRAVFPRILVALAVFGFIAAPWVGALSLKKGSFTFGDSRILNYGLYVNRVIPLTHWRGEEPGFGRAAHPTRQIFVNPPIYEFARPGKGTYPLWYDPSYWYEGLKTSIDIRGHAAALVHNISVLYELVGKYQLWSIIMGFITLALLEGRGVGTRLLRVPAAALLFPAFAAIGMFLLIVVQARYVGPFLVLGGIGLFAVLRPPPHTMAATRAIIIAIALMIMLPTSVSIVIKLTQNKVNEHWQIARALARHGVAPGDSVAIVSSSYNGFHAYWARLARVQIVAEQALGPQNDFWLRSSEEQGRIIDIYASTGAVALVAQEVPSYANLKGWEQLHDRYYVMLFSCSKNDAHPPCFYGKN